MSRGVYEVYGMLVEPPPPEPQAVRIGRSELERRPTNVEPTIRHRESQPLSVPGIGVNREYGAMQVDEDYPAPAASASVLTLESDRLECVFADMVSNDPWDPAGGERPLVVLDCANIGWSYGVDRFSPTGLLIAMRHFHGLGVEVQAFLPANYLRENHQNNLRDRNRASGSGDGGGGGGGRTGVGEAVLAGEAADLRTLQSLAGSSLLTMVPSGDSDDAYFLNYARDRGGFVVTNDLCNDHMRGLLVPSVQTSMRQWLQDHRVGYAFLYGQQGRPSQFLCNPCSQMRQVLDAFAESKQQQQHNQQQQMEAASISSSSTSTSTSPPSILSAASKGGAWLRAVRHTTQLIQLLGDAASAPPSAPCDCDLELKFLLLTRASLLHKFMRAAGRDNPDPTSSRNISSNSNNSSNAAPLAPFEAALLGTSVPPSPSSALSASVPVPSVVSVSVSVSEARQQCVQDLEYVLYLDPHCPEALQLLRGLDPVRAGRDHPA